MEATHAEHAEILGRPRGRPRVQYKLPLPKQTVRGPLWSGRAQPCGAAASQRRAHAHGLKVEVYTLGAEQVLRRTRRYLQTDKSQDSPPFTVTVTVGSASPHRRAARHAASSGFRLRGIEGLCSTCGDKRLELDPRRTCVVMLVVRSGGGSSGSGCRQWWSALRRVSAIVSSPSWFARLVNIRRGRMPGKISPYRRAVLSRSRRSSTVRFDGTRRCDAMGTARRTVVSSVAATRHIATRPAIAEDMPTRTESRSPSERSHDGASLAHAPPPWPPRAAALRT